MEQPLPGDDRLGPDRLKSRTCEPEYILPIQQSAAPAEICLAFLRSKSMWKFGVVIAVALCVPANAQTQAQMKRTAEQEYKSADAAMAREWTSTNMFMKKRDSADRSRGGGFGYAAALLASQRAWLKYRDAQCVIQAGEFAGGSMQSMSRFTCLANLSRARSRELGELRWNR
jgi:uncharacterized protein YecT (DUF1311 family)